jgi:hypothetical protein
MSGPDRAHKRSEHDPQHLQRTLDGLEQHDSALREACGGTSQRAAELRRAGAGVRSDSRAVRGTVLRLRLTPDASCGASVPEEYLDRRYDDVVSDAKTVASRLLNNRHELVLPSRPNGDSWARLPRVGRRARQRGAEGVDAISGLPDGARPRRLAASARCAPRAAGSALAASRDERD